MFALLSQSSRSRGVRRGHRGSARRRGLWPATLSGRCRRVSSRGPLVVTVDEEGVTRVRDRFVVSAPLSGRVLRIELEPGDR